MRFLLVFYKIMQRQKNRRCPMEILMSWLASSMKKPVNSVLPCSQLSQKAIFSEN
jgi:hypothetical protein